MIQLYSFPMTESLNVLINNSRTNRYLAYKDKTLHTSEAAKIAKFRNKKVYKCETFSDKVWVESYFYLRKKRDIDNCTIKPILDGLQAARIIVNDSLVQPPYIIWTRKFNKKIMDDPCVVIVLSDTPVFLCKTISTDNLIKLDDVFSKEFQQLSALKV